MGNKLAGSERAKRTSIRVHEELLEEFDELVEERNSTRTDQIRRLMQLEVQRSNNEGYQTPLRPPLDGQLAYGYERLCQASNASGVIKGSVAEKVTTNGPNNLAKSETRHLVLRPLQRRGYIRRMSNLYGDEAYRIVGWEDDDAEA